MNWRKNLAQALIVVGVPCCVALAMCAAAALGQPSEDSLDKDYAGQLPRIDPLSPAVALARFEVEPGFHVELVASEPLVRDPIAVAFDEYGRLFVVEMRGYSEDRDQNLGVVRRLTDTDADGRYDQSTVFVQGLAWPTAVACWQGGILVGAAPHIYYCRDTDGDGRADEQEIVFTGFGHSNVQGLLNSFTWGLDNRLYGATSSCGAQVTSARDPAAAALSLNRRDFVIEPRTMSIRAASGGGQHGQSFDPFGRRFVCANSNHLQMIMFEDRYVARNPWLAAPAANLDIAADGPQAPVFRTSPVEPWRIVRTRLRVQGLVRGPIEGGGKPAGYFTGATGVTIYQGDAFGADYYGNVFVADCGSNLIHRKVFQRDGVGFVGQRATQRREFLTSRDIWFRPVQMAGAPDGTLYVLDMSREVIEHPDSIPPVIKRHVDLTSGRSQGRIYRIVPDGLSRRASVALGDLSTAELAHLLGHGNGWHRETAARLIYQRQDRGITGLLEELTRELARPEGRIRAMYALAGMDALRPEITRARLADDDPRVREHAVRLAETQTEDSPSLRDALYELADDPDARVRYQLAFSLGEFDGPAREETLAAIVRRDVGDRWVRLAVRSSLARGAGRVFALLADDASFRASAAGQSFLLELADQLGRQNRTHETAHLLKSLPALLAADQDLTKRVLQAASSAAGTGRQLLQEQLARATQGASDTLLDELFEQATRAANDQHAAPEERVDAVRALGIADAGLASETLSGLLDAKHPHEVQLAALRALSRFDEPGIATLIVDQFGQLSPRVRSEAVETLLSRSSWIERLLKTIARGDLAATVVSPAQRQLLLNHPDEYLRAQSQSVLESHALARRADVVAEYQPALELPGDVDRGRKKFRAVCAACHRLEGFGHEIGKDLAAIRNHGPETILVNVLDPNREIDPVYVNYVAVTRDGRSVTGLIATETATSVILRRAENATEVLLRRDIEELQSTGLSIMPEGLEKEITEQEMADLIAYLMSQQ